MPALASPMASLAPGDRVILHGLPSPHKNIQPGRIVSIQGPEISVQLRRPPMLVGSRIRLVNHKKSTYLNGKIGVIDARTDKDGGEQGLMIKFEDDNGDAVHMGAEPHQVELLSPDEPVAAFSPEMSPEDVRRSQSRWGKVVVCQRWQVLRGNCQKSRAVALQIQLLLRHNGLRVARSALDAILPGSSADMPSPLLLHIASFVETGLVFPHQFSGYAGEIRSEFYWYNEAAKSRPFAGPMDQEEEEEDDDKDTASLAMQHQDQGEGASSSSGRSPSLRTEPLDARPRIDCGVAVVGVGQAAFCGGVGTHPQNAHNPQNGRGFYCSAVLYDSLFDHWSSLPPMKCTRHGAAAAAVGRLLFVLGGQYVDAAKPITVSIEEAEERITNHERVVMVGGQPAIIHRRELEAQDFCEVLDLDNLQQGWSPLPFEAYSKLRPGTRHELTSGTAFFPAAAVGSKVVCRLEVPLSVDPGSVYANRPAHTPVVLVYDTMNSAAGWREIWATSRQGSGASGCAHRGAFILASGRPSDTKGKCASAFVFTEEHEEKETHMTHRQRSAEVVQMSLPASTPPPPPLPTIFTGEWRYLPFLDLARGGGGLVSLHGRLFCFGGCDEARHTFWATASELVGLPPSFLTNHSTTPMVEAAASSSRTTAAGGGSSHGNNIDNNDDDDDDDDDNWWVASEAAAAADAADETALAGATWQTAEWLRMPRGLHAHAMLALPRLDWATQ